MNDKVRQIAWTLRRDLNFDLSELVDADTVLAALDKLTGYVRIFVESDDPILAGAQAVLNVGVQSILLATGMPVETSRYDAAHEYAHWFLHHSEYQCTSTDLDLDLPEVSLSATSVVDGYSSHERAESEANAFAAELLLPLPAAKRCFDDLGWNSSQIAKKIGISDAIARRQLTDAVLLPIRKPAEPRSTSMMFPLDESQSSAAEAPCGPLLLSAGPGTGKTRTLVGRCLYLINERHISPKKILALTFSRKAAAEMADRLLSAGIGAEESGPWIGTFHSFGMEVLRKYGDRIGLSQDFQVIDRFDATTLLENNCSRLNLTELTNLFNPTFYFDGILQQVSRAKDELIDPERYASLVAKQLEAAERAQSEFAARHGKKKKADETAIDDMLKNARRAVEVSHVYDIYEKLKAEFHLVDYADLIFQSVKLLSENPDVRAAIHRQYPQVLADEYQDVNRASAYFLRLIAGDRADGLWVVGDHRQSIYQFQGASPANISKFLEEYPMGELKQLTTNYRSVSEIVRTFSCAAQRMSLNDAVPTESQWNAFRGKSLSKTYPVELVELPTAAAQSEYVARKVRMLDEPETKLSNVAVLCRTHRQADEMSRALNNLGVPSLYLGPLLDRPEIKSLISVLAVVAGVGSAGLYTMASLPEYGLSESEVLEIARSEGQFEGETADGSPPDSSGLQRLKCHIQILRQYIDRPSFMLRAYLFEHSRFLANLERESTEFLAVTKKLAIRQFIGIVEDFDKRPIAPANDQAAANRTVKLLRHLAQLTIVGVGSILPDISSVEQINAVRVATIHSVKGLEFPVVFLPNLNEGSFPRKGRHGTVRQPTELPSSNSDDFNEEECLFFVALSRARDQLIITRSLTKNSDGSPSIPSSLLSSLGDVIEDQTVHVIRVEGDPDADELAEGIDGGETFAGGSELFTLSELERYQRCPRSYYYANVLKLEGYSADDGYRKWNRVVHEFLNWFERTSAESVVSEELKLQKLEELWQQFGPVGHVHEAIYRAEAEAMALVDRVPAMESTGQRLLTAKLHAGTVQINSDGIYVDENSVTIGVRKVGRPDPADRTDKRLALIRRAAEDSYPGRDVVVNLSYSADGSVTEVPANAKYEPARVLKYEKAIEGIRWKQFSATPESPETCRTCAFLLVCPRR